MTSSDVTSTSGLRTTNASGSSPCMSCSPMTAQSSIAGCVIMFFSIFVGTNCMISAVIDHEKKNTELQQHISPFSPGPSLTRELCSWTSICRRQISAFSFRPIGQEFQRSEYQHAGRSWHGPVAEHQHRSRHAQIPQSGPLKIVASQSGEHRCLSCPAKHSAHFLLFLQIRRWMRPPPLSTGLRAETPSTDSLPPPTAGSSGMHWSRTVPALSTIHPLPERLPDPATLTVLRREGSHPTDSAATRHTATTARNPL
jgi:hypothetical protein